MAFEVRRNPDGLCLLRRLAPKNDPRADHEWATALPAGGRNLSAEVRSPISSSAGRRVYFEGGSRTRARVSSATQPRMLHNVSRETRAGQPGWGVAESTSGGSEVTRAPEGVREERSGSSPTSPFGELPRENGHRAARRGGGRRGSEGTRARKECPTKTQARHVEPPSAWKARAGAEVGRGAAVRRADIARRR